MVRALIARTRIAAVKKSLRKLEMRLLEEGHLRSRTSDDLVRYHGKMLIVDRRVLNVNGFNFTGLDIAKSRSFGATTRNPTNWYKRRSSCSKPTVPGSRTRPASSASWSARNCARERLGAFIKGARANSS